MQTIELKGYLIALTLLNLSLPETYFLDTMPPHV